MLLSYVLWIEDILTFINISESLTSETAPALSWPTEGCINTVYFYMTVMSAYLSERDHEINFVPNSHVPHNETKKPKDYESSVSVLSEWE